MEENRSRSHASNVNDHLRVDDAPLRCLPELVRLYGDPLVPRNVRKLPYNLHGGVT